MASKVYIIHGSAIVQHGIADILRKNFKCAVECFSDLPSLKESDESLFDKTIVFAEDKIANSDEYIDFLSENNGVKSFSIVISKTGKLPEESQYTLFLYSTPEEIYEHVKHVFEQQEFVEEETEGLTNREVDVLKLVALGYANKEIAEKLFISTHTVMSHRKNITEKLGIKSISGLTVYAIINNYIDTTNMNVKDLI